MPLPLPYSNNSIRSVSELELVEEHLPVPTTRPDPSVPGEAANIPGLLPVHCPTRPICIVVASICRPFRNRLHHPRRCATRPMQICLCTRGDVLEFSRLQFLTTICSHKFEAPIDNAITAAHRRSTMVQFENCWKNFQDWLRTKD